MSQPAPQNLMIRASAGSGKTYRLTSRFIQLMAGGRSAESIVALTFTRKAAGEFFDEIGRKLAGAASDPNDASKLATEIGFPDFTTDDFRKLLRAFLAAMPKLILGTFDSFFHRIVGLFPFEFGFPGSFEPLDEYRAEQARVDTVARILKEGPEELLRAVELATCGNAESGLLWRLQEIAKVSHALLLCGADEDRWGNADRVWPDGCDLVPTLTKPERIAHTQALMDAIAADDYFDKPPSRQKGVDCAAAICEQVRQLEPGGSIAGLDTPIGNIRKALPDLLAEAPCGVALSSIRWKPRPDAYAPLIAIIRHIDGCRLQALLDQASGTRELLALFENHYQSAVRAVGRGDFADVQNLLSGEIALYHNTPAFHLAAGVASDADFVNPATTGETAGLNISSRLGVDLTHWLLDEFQDTSYPQWQVLEPLIEESLGEPGCDSSLFYVGDVKQAIFGWRGGDSRLFLDVFGRFNDRRAGSITDEPMDKSWRSGPALMETINEVFGSDSPLERLFGDDADSVRRWRDSWQDHSTEHTDRQDYVRLSHATSKEDRPAAVYEILDEVQPHLRGMSCAILCRTNPGATMIADHLRVEAPDIPVVLDAEIKAGADNPLATLFLAALTLVQHPADQMAAGHLRMSPLRELLWPSPEGYPVRTEEIPFPKAPGASTAIRELATALYDHGFAGALDHFLNWIEVHAGIELDGFSQSRAASLAHACAEFDETGDRSVFAFRKFLENHTRREPAPKGVVQIMTIHRSKGLGFDCVILADLEGNAMDVERTTPLWAKQDRSRHNEWVIARPKSDVATSDPVLAAEQRRRKDEECFESLCQLYVALTRAKFGTYVITTKPKPGAKSQRGLLNETLVPPDEEQGAEASRPPTNPSDPESTPPEIDETEKLQETVYECGSDDWYNREEKFTLEVPIQPIQPINQDPVTQIPQRRFPARESLSPSGVVSSKANAFQIFNANAWKSAGHGTIVHQLLEKLEFIDPAKPPTAELLSATWAEVLDQVEPAAAKKASNEVLAALQNPAIAAALAKPTTPAGGEVELWRERRFEVIVDDQWVSGVFDRVTLTRDAQGRPTAATITDFKTNAVRRAEQIDEAAEQYRPQLDLYREVLSEMTGLPDAAIRCELLFTVPAEVRGSVI